MGPGGSDGGEGIGDDEGIDAGVDHGADTITGGTPSARSAGEGSS